MNLKTYTLLVALASVIGLLVSTVPIVRGLGLSNMPEELASPEAFFAARGRARIEEQELRSGRRGAAGVSDWRESSDERWQAMFAAARANHAQEEREKLYAFGVLAALCIVLLITHLLWARRLSATPQRAEN